ncbi:unnamed protein product [Closterium sp. Naga37s-1]|nr:unnamed protein product [Closterium sp. Naga37s-1]
MKLCFDFAVLPLASTAGLCLHALPFPCPLLRPLLRPLPPPLPLPSLAHSLSHSHSLALSAAVKPSASTAATSAPRASSRRTTPSCPAPAARCRAVAPPALVLAPTDAPCCREEEQMEC